MGHRRSILVVEFWNCGADEERRPGKSCKDGLPTKTDSVSSEARILIRRQLTKPNITPYIHQTDITYGRDMIRNDKSVLACLRRGNVKRGYQTPLTQHYRLVWKVECSTADRAFQRSGRRCNRIPMVDARQIARQKVGTVSTSLQGRTRD